nr:unknown [Picea sitchensis]
MGGLGGMGGMGGLGGMGGMDFSSMGGGGMGGMDFSGMGGGGMDFSGMGGGDEADSDDEDQEPPKEDSLEAKTLKIEPEDSNPESTVEVPAKV